MTSKKIITLIHGTFARDADWIQFNSDVAKYIKKELTGEIEFDKFLWSGKNSHKDRINAGKELKIFLEKQTKNYPNYERIIIAHSHGGNIALYALKNMKVNDEVIKLVTLSTPFLNIKARDFSSNLEFVTTITTLIILPILIILSYAILFVLLSILYLKYINPNWTTAYITFGIISFLIYFLSMRAHFGLKIFDLEETIPVKTKMLFEEFSIENSYPNILFVVIYDRLDEVKIYFRIMSNIWEILFSLVDLIISFNRKTFKFLIYFAIGGSVLVYIVLALISKFIYHLDIDAVMEESGPTIISTLVATPICLVILPIILLLIRSNPLVLGNEKISQMFFIKTIPSAIPKLKTKNPIILKFKTHKKNIFTLKHSIYENEHVLSVMCSAIN